MSPGTSSVVTGAKVACEADYSSSSRAKIMNVWNFTSTILRHVYDVLLGASKVKLL
jgi:hypothetical protein